MPDLQTQLTSRVRSFGHLLPQPFCVAILRGACMALALHMVNTIASIASLLSFCDTVFDFDVPPRTPRYLGH